MNWQCLFCNWKLNFCLNNVLSLKMKTIFSTESCNISYVQSSTPAIFHASLNVLEPVDRVQRRLLRELGLSEVDALLNFRLAPLPSRRDIAMLGFLHKVTLGSASMGL